MTLLAALTAALSITVWPQGPGGPAVQRQVTCPGAAVCARLARAGRGAFAPVAPGTVCTQIYGGPREALVTGRLDGRRLRARFKRSNGCEIARWDRVAFLLRT